MASREGVAISGAAQNDTAFHGFVSVQRLSRQMGKSAAWWEEMWGERHLETLGGHHRDTKMRNGQSVGAETGLCWNVPG